MKMKKLIATILVFAVCACSIPFTTIQTQAASSYWIKVNKQANVATVYQLKAGKWVAVKAMLTSCGGSNTPSGTYNTKAKYRWHELMGPSWGQYCTRIVGGILFHSVWYYKNGSRTSQAVAQFNKLGKTASHGCVRLSTEDSKWIYDNCSIGTKVTIYSSSNPGPLGKPAAYKMPASAGRKNWDPTDAVASNPYNQTLPILTQKVKTIPYGSTIYTSAKRLVTAKQKNGKALKSLSVSVKKYNTAKKKYLAATFSPKSTGKYSITYKAVGAKGVSITKTFVFSVIKDTSAPLVTLTKASDIIGINSKNAVRWLSSAKMKDGTDRLTATKVYIKQPGATAYDAAMTYDAAKTYSFTKTGVYTVKYVVSNKNNTSAITTKTVSVTVKRAMITTPNGNRIEVENGAALDLTQYAKATDYNGALLPVSTTDVVDTTVPGEYVVTYRATASNNYPLTATVTFVVK